MKVLFLDESGDSFGRVDPAYPVFVLGGPIMDLKYSKDALPERVGRFKEEYCSSGDDILHCCEMTKARGCFSHLADPGCRHRFYDGLNTMMEELPYNVVACAIRTDGRIAARRGSKDLYVDALHPLVERFCMALSPSECGWIYVESRSPHQDTLLYKEWERILDQGTSYCEAEVVQRKVLGFIPREKARNLPGLQIADLLVNPIGRMVLGKKENTTRYDIIEKKFRRHMGRWRGPGLVLFE